MTNEFEVLDDRQWIDPAFDGIGGGYGKFKGISISEMTKLFRQMGREPNMRSFTGILRIAYEQLEIRSHLSVSLYGAVVLGAVTAALAMTLPFYGEPTRSVLLKATGLAGALFLGFFLGAIGTMREAKAAHAQERAISEMTTYALDRIASLPDFKTGRLDSVQHSTLKRVLKQSKIRSTALENLLKSSS